MKRFLLIVSFFATYTVAAQITLIPDQFFEAHLVVAGIDTDGEVNGQVLTADIADEETLIMIENGAVDLTGIEDFAALKTLSLLNFNIQEMDLSQNSNLEDLDLDNVTLESLDLTGNPNLEILIISPNTTYPSTIPELDLSNNLNLRWISIFNIPISELDLSSNSALEDISIGGAMLGITHLDVSSNTALRDFAYFGFSESINYINLQNGNNTNILSVDIIDNPNLQCIQVDDPAAVIAGTDPPYDNWIIENNDSNPLITDDCQFGIEEFLLQNLHVFPNPVNDILYVEALDGIEVKAMRLCNELGQVVMSSKVTQLDLSGLPTGFYLLSIETDKGTITKKLSKL
ncbi:MAG: hypothetical protein Aureis2KO_18040 [Aureisphaera sp.]